MGGNPLLKPSALPQFNNIQPENIEPALKTIISENRDRLKKVLSGSTLYSWDNVMVPLEEMNERLSQMWAPISHLHAVMESEPLRKVYNACLPLLTEYSTELMQNEQLYKAIQTIASHANYSTLHPAQRKIIQNYLRDFTLAGVGLTAEKKEKFTQLQKELSQLSTKFSEHILDATQAWTLHITNKELLKGLPDTALSIAEQNAKQRQLKGWVLTLDYASYSTAIKYLEDRELRHTLYQAYVTRASDKGPNAGQFDNTQIMQDIVARRHTLATLLGFKQYADYSLATKMADSPERVLTFLNELVSQSKVTAEKEMQALAQFAKTVDGIHQLEAWDLTFYSEKLREATYSISQEELRSYFPINKVLQGLFAILSRLYGLRIVEKKQVDVWHPSVQFFEVYDAHNQLRGYFYTDLYARQHKREGAWMDSSHNRRRLADGSIQYPVAFLTCNFTRPLDDKPALLTHDEVQTLFHEFGHVLHHILTQVDYASVSGINGVPWDAVEFPSQFLEYWCFEKEALTLISEHKETGESIPQALYDKLVAAKHFQSGMQMLRQLEFALFDFRLHNESGSSQHHSIQTLLDSIRKQVSVVPTPPFNRFQHSFSHIFAGGYAAGYYSYKWSEVLSADAFELFDQNGIFDEATGQAFLTRILEKGGERSPMELYKDFRGREPSIDALIKYSGL